MPPSSSSSPDQQQQQPTSPSKQQKSSSSSPPSTAIQNAIELTTKNSQEALQVVEQWKNKYNKLEVELRKEKEKYRELLTSVLDSVNILSRLDMKKTLQHVMDPSQGAASNLKQLAIFVLKTQEELRSQVSRLKDEVNECKANESEHRKLDKEKIARLEKELSRAKHYMQQQLPQPPPAATYAPHPTTSSPLRSTTTTATTTQQQPTTTNNSIDTPSLLKFLVEEQSKTLRSLQEHVFAAQRTNNQPMIMPTTSPVISTLPCCHHHCLPQQQQPSNQDYGTKLTRLREDFSNIPPSTSSQSRELELLDLLEQGEQLFNEWKRTQDKQRRNNNNKTSSSTTSSAAQPQPTINTTTTSTTR
jgi:hypothetical protein